jgi:Tfp pilus assembly protein PilO
LQERQQIQAAKLQALRAQIQRMKDLYGEPNCFLANAAFRKLVADWWHLGYGLANGVQT